ncbi:hypothetical protein D1871_16020 [Nakamurella silvestris]|nr:hypothetical protein D1871_16020 [Nakamurella silvestris]
MPTQLPQPHEVFVQFAADGLRDGDRCSYFLAGHGLYFSFVMSSPGMLTSMVAVFGLRDMTVRS